MNQKYSAEAYPLIESQRGIYLECMAEPTSLKYNLPALCRLPDGLDAKRFADALRTVAGKHPALHVSIRLSGGVPSMFYQRRQIPIEEKDVADVSAACHAFLRPFDLENGPLFHFELLHQKESLWLLFDIHHIVFDGSSVGPFLRQIFDVYDGGVCPEEALTIFDISAAEALPKDPEREKLYQELFRRKLEGADCDCTVIPDQVKENGPDGQGFYTRSAAGRFTAEDVQKFVRDRKITENALFLGAFGYALSKFNGTSESVFTTAHTGRTDARLADTVGMFVRTLPIACSFDENAAVVDYLREVCDDYYLIKKNDCIAFSDLAAQYGVNTSCYFIYQGTLLSGIETLHGSASVELLNTNEAVSDLALMVKKVGNSYELLAEYKKALYSDALIVRFVNLYLNVVEGMLHAGTLGEILLTDAEDAQILDKFNRTEAAYEDTATVVSLFRRQAQKTPDNVCLVCRDRRFTYREVDALTDKLALHLVEKGVKAESVVGVLIPRCEYMLICSLGILKAGGAYLPLDPTYPPERLNLMMEDSGAMMLICDPSLREIITPDFTGLRMFTDEISTLQPEKAELPVPQPQDLFVMLYTSGSTGKPKGVMYQHSNCLVTTEWVKKYFEMDETSRVTAYASYGFDAHTFDMYPAVTSGAQLHIIPDELRLDFPALKNYFNENGITHTVMTTQVGRQFAQMGGLDTLKHLSVAGEKLTPPDAPELFRLYNLYGPTEGSVITSAFRIDCRYKDVPIGAAVDNLKTYIVDKTGRLLPVGAVGELWIAGPHVTRGYLNRPEKTAEAYGENPFCKDAGYERIYRTGDIVRLMPDGNLQFVGRRDAQVKVRGFRVELTEIEEIIRRFPGITDATVAAFDDPAGGKFLAGYVVSRAPVDPDALAAFIRSEKPPYMVPAAIMQLDAIPLTQNQKVNKRALPVPQRKVGAITPPENETQQKIFDLAADVLGHKEFGIDTGFYEAGLTSIGAVRLNVVLAEAFDTPIRIADIKANDTVRKLEKFLEDAIPQEQYPMQDDYPITETQRGILVECMAAPDTTVYNIPVLMKLGSGVDTAKLANAVKAAVNAHPYVKTKLFTAPDGDVRARRLDEAPVEVPVVKRGTCPDLHDLVKPFALLNAPLFRLAIYETASGSYLFMDFHHIICDGTSEAILFRDIDRAYAGEALAPEAFSGFEAALAEQTLRSSERFEQAQQYWNATLFGCDTEILPKSDAENAEGGAGCLHILSKPNAPAVKAFCEKNGLSLNGFFNGVFCFVLSRFIGKENISYATIYNGRNDSRLAQAVTMLVKTIPVGVHLDFDCTVTDFVRQIQQQLLDSMANDACSFADLSRTNDAKADVIFVYQGSDFRFDRLCGEPAQLVEIPPQAAKAPISINVYAVDDHFEYVAEYRRDLYSARFLSALTDAINAAADSFMAVQTLAEVSMLSENAEAVYARLNDTDMDLGTENCIQMFERCAAQAPDTVAVTADGRSMTYGELNRCANIIAHRLISLGVGRDSIVALVLERSCEIPMTQFAIMKSGGAFLPVLPDYPDERIEYCLTNADCPCVITTEAIRAQKPALFADGKPYKTLTIEELLDGSEAENPNVPILPEQLAYCIYTSGSTGKPKGVMIEHRNFANTIAGLLAITDFYRCNCEGSVLASCSVSFDASILDLFLPLCSGRHLVICTDEEHLNPLAMRDLMLQHKVAMMVSTPSYLSNLTSMPALAGAFSGLRSIISGAEAFPRTLYEALKNASAEMQIINGYGPTECTVCCSFKQITDPENITIGIPTPNMKLYVADKLGHVLPPYAVGELMICGAGVGRGYVKLPEKNAASFVTFRSQRAYHSGDLVRLNGNAEIEFGGRIDNQVKLRGFRVELDEIENVMRDYDGVRQSKVLVRNNGHEDYLVGFYVAERPIDPEELTAYMKSRLTYYMVPAAMMQLAQMPLTPNGKIDKNAFPEVQQAARKSGRKAPKKSLEQRLCEIYRSVLNLDEVYADDSFFELGGTSLSASKVTMLLMSEGIEVKYGDIFDNPTPEDLSRFIEQRDAAEKAAKPALPLTALSATREALKWNMVRYAPEVKRESLGNVLLTGAVGFLGIHILKELLELESGRIFCLVRKGSHENAVIRLKTMLIYYFSNGFDDALQNRISVIDADITDASLEDTLKDVPFDTVINCAACVKHFSDSDILDRINVHGVENLIAICQKRNAKLIQISTTSVPGIHTPETYEKQIRMHEHELFVIDDMKNKYGISKYQAELRMFDAIEAGLRGKVIRVGNLMGRHSDGEFQANLETNMFLSGIRGFALLGKYPISHMTDPMRFSPIDCTARAVVLLAGTNDKFTAFHADNRYGFDEMKIIDACNRNGITILPEADEVYYAEYHKKLGDARVNAKLNGLAAYDIPDAHAVETDNLFTTNILYRIGFSWPLVDETYLDRAIHSILTLDYFGLDELEED